MVELRCLIGTGDFMVKYVQFIHQPLEDFVSYANESEQSTELLAKGPILNSSPS